MGAVEAGNAARLHDATAERHGDALAVEAGSDVTAEKLRRFCLDRIAEYKHPRKVTFLDELPRTDSSKAQKFKLEERDGDAESRSDE